jgi:hypothetical protein
VRARNPIGDPKRHLHARADQYHFIVLKFQLKVRQLVAEKRVFPSAPLADLKRAHALAIRSVASDVGPRTLQVLESVRSLSSRFSAP